MSSRRRGRYEQARLQRAMPRQNECLGQKAVVRGKEGDSEARRRKAGAERMWTALRMMRARTTEEIQRRQVPFGPLCGGGLCTWASWASGRAVLPPLEVGRTHAQEQWRCPLGAGHCSLWRQPQEAKTCSSRCFLLCEVFRVSRAIRQATQPLCVSLSLSPIQNCASA